MKNPFFKILVIIGLLILLTRLAARPIMEIIGDQAKAGLKIISTPAATVMVNGVEMGNTPYQDENFKPGEYNVALKSNNLAWEGKVKLNQGAMTVVNRDLKGKMSASSGETLTLLPGQGIVITSIPDGARVEIDGKTMGTTPLIVADLAVGNHTFILSQEKFLKRSIIASLPQEMSLYIDVNLAAEQNEQSTPLPTVAPLIYLIIRNTPNGFLRVRDKPSLQGKEVARISEGESVSQLEKLTGWYKVRLQNGIEGYISGSFVNP